MVMLGNMPISTIKPNVLIASILCSLQGHFLSCYLSHQLHFLCKLLGPVDVSVIMNVVMCIKSTLSAASLDTLRLQLTCSKHHLCMTSVCVLC